jgi:hypothetical protein
MLQCPECGNIDSLGLGFCTICGRTLPKPIDGKGVHSNASMFSDEVESANLEEAMQKIYTGLMMVLMMGVFMFVFLLMSGTDLLLILMVEAFPIMWFLVILIQWRLIKGNSGNDGDR